MAVTTFDTHAAVRAMEEAGLESAQAEAITETIRSAVTEGVATQADLAALEARLTERINAQTWRILGGVFALLALWTAVDRLLG